MNYAIEEVLAKISSASSIFAQFASAAFSVSVSTNKSSQSTFHAPAARCAACRPIPPNVEDAID
jgi:hypothetical protein